MLVRKNKKAHRIFCALLIWVKLKYFQVSARTKKKKASKHVIHLTGLAVITHTGECFLFSIYQCSPAQDLFKILVN